MHEPSFDRLFPRLLAGEADVVAHGLTITDERKKQVAFTRPISSVKQLLIGKKGVKTNPKKAAELKGRTVTVHAGSAYAQTLQALGIKDLTLANAPEELDSEGVVYLVGRGEIPLTVTDSNVFDSIAAYNRDVEALFPVAEGKEIAWAVRPEAKQLKAMLDAFLVEKAMTSWSSKPFTEDLDAIKKRGVIRLITWNDPFSYFGYRGQLFGFDYELTQQLAAKLGVRVDVVVPPRRELMVSWLEQGKGDLIAASLHPDPAFEKRVSYSKPYLSIDLLQVGSGTPVLSVGNTHGVPGTLSTDAEADDGELVEQVRDGKLGAAVIDKELYDAMPPFAAAVPVAVLKPQQPLVVATRTTNPRLLKAVNGFFDAQLKGLEFAMLKKRYITANRAMEAVRTAEAAQTGQLSPFDALFKSHASRTGLDWRLLASQAYQESKFDPKAKSWAGAVGLFQLMPATAAELKVIHLEDPEQSIRAGADYLASLSGRVDTRADLQNRLRMALAAYNAGFGHLEDAQRLAKERGLDPTKWFNNVDKAFQLLERPAYYQRARHGYCRATEPVNYVSQIQQRYESYVKLAP
ncbi:MAG: transporter substrate-binding domain-containing protein [Myxococcaceae bacterium]